MTNARLTRLPLNALLDAFSSADPTPGGGSASALAGAVGASLLVMIASLPKTRTNAPEERDALAQAAAHLRRHRDELLQLVDRDTEAYDKVVAAYRLPKGTPDEQQARRDAIQHALVQAIETPLAMMRAASEALARAVDVARAGNLSAWSDLGVATELLSAAVRGARLNVEINLESLKDAAQAGRARGEAERLSSEAASAAELVRSLLAR